MRLTPALLIAALLVLAVLIAAVVSPAIASAPATGPVAIAISAFFLWLGKK